jgi:hypothetical protein
MAMRRPGPQNCLSFDHHEAAAGTRMLPRTSEGQKGAVAVVGILNMPGYPFIGEYNRFRSVTTLRSHRLYRQASHVSISVLSVVYFNKTGVTTFAFCGVCQGG